MSGADDASDSLAGLRILLLEDEPLIRIDLQSSLSELGATVATATNAAAALEIMATSALDFAVLDFELGCGTSEPVAAAALVRRVPFFYLSGYGEKDDRFARWPRVEVLVKPISISTLAHRIRAALNKKL